jgi:hypothetical protein
MYFNPVFDKIYLRPFAQLYKPGSFYFAVNMDVKIRIGMGQLVKQPGQLFGVFMYKYQVRYFHGHQGSGNTYGILLIRVFTFPGYIFA